MTDALLAADQAVRARAIDPARSFIVQAPAGSGKTSLLTLRFLRLLGVAGQPEEIVAVTFTRKAANEMQARIVTALSAAQRGSPVPPGELARQEREFALSALERSRELGWGLEDNPARLHIQTLDGMNHWLARRLPLAARIGLSVSLLDDARALYHEAAQRFVARLEESGEVGRHIEALARLANHDPAGLARLVAGMLASRELWLPKLLESGNGESLREEIGQLLQAAARRELAEVGRALEGLPLDDLAGPLREAAALGPDDGPLQALRGLCRWPAAVPEERACWEQLVELVLTTGRPAQMRKTVTRQQGFYAKSEGPAWAPLKAAFIEALTRLGAVDGVAAVLSRIRELPPAQLSDGQWQRIEALREVMPQAVAELDLLFAEQGQVDHAAVAAAARTALGTPDAPSELALALDYRLRHLLVDEYQDTSPAQVALLRLLLRGWEPGDGRTLFCVGDPMQSIYAFREADVTLFLEAQQRGIGPVALESGRLQANFRSCAAIVDWVNATFGQLLPAENDFERGAVRYSPAQATRPTEGSDGVFIHPLINGDEARMGQEVAALAGRLLADPGLASIAILVRGRIALPPVLSALREAGIAYRGLELESLAQRSAIRDLVALLKALLHPGDRSAWLAALRAPWCGLELADLHALASDPDALPVDRLQDAVVLATLSADGAARVRRFMQALLPALADRGSRSLGGWLKSAWLALLGPATLEDSSDLANAELLFSVLDGLEAEAGGWPEASLVDEAVDGIMASPLGGEDARVQLMTIHRAKGLQFDAVILPDLQRQPRGHDRELMYWTTVATAPEQRGIILASRGEAGSEPARDALEAWMKRLTREREALELGRVAYVATTRARQQLHLLGSVTTAETEEGIELKRPRGGSLLDFLWPSLEEDFAAALRELPPGQQVREADAGPRARPSPPRRLPLLLQLAAPAADLSVPVLQIVGAERPAMRPDFDWASLAAAAAGQVVHQELHRLARQGRPASDIEMDAARWTRMLRQLGVGESHLAEATGRVGEALRRVAQSPIAARLLDPAQAEAASEIALSAQYDGEVVGLRIDRSFVDASGTRWIVDWKTSAHEGTDVDAFLDNELGRYRQQLQRYADVMARLDGRPQRVGLYFPLLDAWRELDPRA